MKINIEIDKLVLHGFTPSEQTNIRALIIAELNRAFKEGYLFTNNVGGSTFDVGTLKINTSANPQKIGHVVAHTIQTYCQAVNK
jgi:hypothetical protein